MEVKVISATIQEFDGERFYLCGNYFLRKGKRLHVTVWKKHNGDIPHGYHVHHIDGNRSNNDISNLELVLGRMHISRHSSAPEREEYNQQHIKDMRELASEWHKSEEGLRWHSEQGKKNWQKREMQQHVCMCCGKVFESKHVYGENVNVFCGNACKSEYRRQSGVDDVERTCAYCGKKFTVNKYARAKCCGRECAVNLRWKK